MELFFFLVTDATRLKTNLRLTTVCSTFLNRSLIFVCVCVCVFIHMREIIISLFQRQILPFKYNC